MSTQRRGSATSRQPSAPRTELVEASPTRPSQHHSARLAHHVGRIPVTELFPVVEGGAWPAKATAGEPFPVRATVFREGHDHFGATAVLISPDGSDFASAPMVEVLPGLNRYEGWLCPDRPGDWSFRVEGWSDPYGTWLHDATVKVDAGVDVELMLAVGSALLRRAAARPEIPDDVRAVLVGAAAGLADSHLTAAQRLAHGTAAQVQGVLAAHPVRDMLSPSQAYPLAVDRPRALVGSWYEMFPRSEGARFDPKRGTWISGTFATAAQRLDAIADMGFDVVYLTPVHPIGITNRKGRNNALTARKGDPGSPYGIGGREGGHDAIHPDLGTFADFDAFVAHATDLGMEVALDLALQCSPDHPWVTEHPEWFTTRLDGSIAYAENPPKKYQDIYPLNFDNDPDGLFDAIVAVVQTWIDHGVTIFRVDNPHTKPLPFWQKFLAYFRDTNPDIVFLAEAFTKPAMMRTLGAIGFHQSYTYFAWRNTKDELASYLEEVSRETAHLMRPAFWPTTHDILTPFMQQGGTAAYAVRAVLAATGSPTWGIYSGYEFVENIARPGFEEAIDNEKYEYKPRPWAQAEATGLPLLLGSLNRIRRAHPALRQLHNITIHPTSDDKILAYSRFIPAQFSPTGADDAVLVVVNLDPFSTRESMVYVNRAALGLADSAEVRLRDELTGAEYTWGGEGFVRLDPRSETGHIFAVLQ